MHIAGLLCFLNIFLYCLKEYSETLQRRLNLLSILLITMYFSPVMTGIYYLAAVRQPLNKNSTFLLSFSIHIGIVLISHKKLNKNLSNSVKSQKVFPFVKTIESLLEKILKIAMSAYKHFFAMKHIFMHSAFSLRIITEK